MKKVRRTSQRIIRDVGWHIKRRMRWVTRENSKKYEYVVGRLHVPHNGRYSSDVLDTVRQRERRAYLAGWRDRDQYGDNEAKRVNEYLRKHL